VGRDQSAAIDLGLAILEREAKLNGEPEQPREGLSVFFIGVRGDHAEALQEVREDRMCVQRHVSEDIMEDVWLRNVVERVSRADRHRSREAALGERLEEELRLEESAHGNCAPTSLALEAGVHFIQIGDVFAGESDDFDPMQERARGVLLEMRDAAVIQRLPNLMIFRRVSIPILADVESLEAHLDLLSRLMRSRQRRRLMMV
jgi:hypothetical protein